MDNTGIIVIVVVIFVLLLLIGIGVAVYFLVIVPSFGPVTPSPNMFDANTFNIVSQKTGQYLGLNSNGQVIQVSSQASAMYLQAFNSANQEQPYSAIANTQQIFKIIFDGNNGGTSSPFVGQVLNSGTVGALCPASPPGVNVTGFTSSPPGTQLWIYNPANQTLQTQPADTAAVLLYTQILGSNVLVTHDDCSPISTDLSLTAWTLPQVNASGAT